ncbi:MAG: hypothetical protein AAFX85_17580, partial [Pseudomonadota bacterium]
MMRTRQAGITLMGVLALSVAIAQPPPAPRPPAGPPPGAVGGAAPPGYPIGQRLYRLPPGYQQVRYSGRIYVF